MGRQSFIGAIPPTNSKREWRAKNPVILVCECVPLCTWWEGGTKSKIVSDQTRRLYWKLQYRIRRQKVKRLKEKKKQNTAILFE